MRIIDGPFPWILIVVAGALTGDAVRRLPLSWYRRALPYVVGVATATTVVLWYAVHHIHGLIADATDDYPRWIDALAGVAIALLFTALLSWRRNRWPARMTGLAATVAVCLVAGDQLAIRYGYPPDLRTVLGLDVPGAHRFDQAGFAPPSTAPMPAGAPLPTGSPSTAPISHHDEPATGRGELLSQVQIPATTSGFTARSAYVYLPPSYFASPRPALSVLVLLAGVPGQPKNWLDGLDAQKVFGAFAATHGGWAPILVFPDYTGGFQDDRGCIDSTQGNVETYLTVDVPRFVSATFGAASGPSRWGVGGFSDGGTCALMVGLRHPDVYGAILSFSGDASPSFNGDEAQYVAHFLQGDASAFAAHDPLELLQRGHLPATTSIYLEAGDREPKKAAQTRALADAARGAGIPTDLVTKSGQHNFDFWRQCVVDAVPWVADHLHVVS